jgi:hypothetical protein
VLSETTNSEGEIVKVRLCLDPRDLNKWVKREHYRTRTIDEVVTELKDAKFFTVVDARKGYWHVPLDEESSYLTTFSTPLAVIVSTDYPLVSLFLKIHSRSSWTQYLKASMASLV